MRFTTSRTARGVAALSAALIAAVAVPTAASAEDALDLETVEALPLASAPFSPRHCDAESDCVRGGAASDEATGDARVLAAIGPSISGEAYDEEGLPLDGTAVLFTWEGARVAEVPVAEGAYAFDSTMTPAGDYKVLVYSDDVDIASQWAAEPDSPMPARITVAFSDPGAVAAPDVELDDSEAFVWAIVTQKATWDADTLCVAFYDETFTTQSTSTPVAIDCAAPGQPVRLDRLDPDQYHAMRVAPRELTTAAAWKSYRGDDYWYGNQDVIWDSAAIHLGAPGDWWLADAHFTDVDWTKSGFEAISWMVNWGYADGFADGTYRPRTSVNRAQMARFLYRYAVDYGDPTVETPLAPPFFDVPESASNYTPILWMTQSGLADGFPDGSYRPTSAVNRAQMARFLYRFAGEPAVDLPAKSPFTDVPTTASNYAAIVWMTEAGLADGFSDGTFRPTNPVNRSQMANFMYKFWLSS
ncbi:S-layer homology domain-containing protein [Demequina maris]|uniref:S-layer homology domain-containing protein n=1 Tax=Demequina maris TaxID=1638982 RepID=UPI0007853476|nr:S-layer homology domain-containing protein [Demequina maris]